MELLKELLEKNVKYRQNEGKSQQKLFRLKRITKSIGILEKEKKKRFRIKSLESRQKCQDVP